MKKLHILYLILLLAGAGLFVVYRNASTDKRSTGAADSGTQRKKRKKRPPPPPLVRLVGHVQEAEGKPVKGATVFILPKKKRGAERDDVPHVVTTADGKWTLRTRKLIDCWVGMVAPGYRNAYLDGNTVDPKVQMFLVATPAPPLEVRLLDRAKQPVGGQGVQLEPWPPADGWFLPGPEARQPEVYAVTDKDGVARFRLGTSGPVRLSAQIEGRHTHPGFIWLADARGSVPITVHESTTLEAKVHATEDKTPIEGVITLELYDPESGRVVGSYTDITKAPGLLRVERALPPGTYDVHLSREGFATSITPGFTVPEHPAVARLEATLNEAPESGRLRVRLEGIAGTANRRARRRAPLTWLLRADEGWERLGWLPGAPEEWKRDVRQLTYQLTPGRYHLLVADVVSGRATIVEGLDIQAGVSLDKTLRLQPGIQPILPAPGLGLDDANPRHVRISAGRWKRLPIFGSTPEARIRMGDMLECISRQDCGESVRLGPYPFPEITLRVEDWSGGTKTYKLN